MCTEKKVKCNMESVVATADQEQMELLLSLWEETVSW